jgi:hypothetical protein
MPGNDATRKKSAGRTKIETINPNAGVLPFNLIQTFASGSSVDDKKKEDGHSKGGMGY